MGYISTHGPGCTKEKSIPLKCRHCGTPVVYFECSCGSKVFFNQDHTGKHYCSNMPQADVNTQRGVNIQKKDANKIISEYDFVASAWGKMDDDGKWKTKKGRQKCFHRIDSGCKYANNIQGGGRRVFKSEKEAENEGYRKCKWCFWG